MKDRNCTVFAVGLLALAVTGTQTRAQSIYTPYTFTTLAGMSGAGGTNDGNGSAARFSFPNGVAVDTNGNVYVADWRNDTIRKITTAGAVTTFAGSAGQIGSANGTGSAARFYSPIGVAVDSATNVYVGDYGNNTIRKITPGRVVTTLAGCATTCPNGYADGTGSTARFNNPGGVAVDSAGNVYVADEGNSTIRKGALSQLSIAGVQLLEGNSGTTDLVFTVTLSVPSPNTVSVVFSTSNGTAMAGSDYVATNGVITFAPGETNKSIAVMIVGDTDAEPDEMFRLVLNDPTNAVIDHAEAVGTILNDDSNQSPIVANPIPDQTGTYGSAFIFTFAINTFTDPDAGQTLSYAASNLPSGITFDDATRTFSGTPTNTGPYSVTVTATDNGAPPLNTNDTFNIVVDRAPLTVSANNTNRAYGEANPVFTGTLVGVTNSDDLNAAFTTTATPGSPPGNYPITPTLQDPNSRLGNYTVITNNGTLTVNGVTLEFSLSSGSPNFCWPTNAADFNLEYTDSLTPPIAWQPVTSGITTNSSTICITATPAPATPTRFYRLHLP